MLIGLRLELGLERQLDLLARQQGMNRSVCIREAIRQVLLRHGDRDDARRQSEHLAQLEPPNWSEQGPDWSRSTASRLLHTLTSTLMAASLVRIAAVFTAPPLIRDEILGQAVVL